MIFSVYIHFSQKFLAIKASTLHPVSLHRRTLNCAFLSMSEALNNPSKIIKDVILGNKYLGPFHQWSFVHARVKFCGSHFSY